MSLPETLPMSWTKYQASGECGCVLCGRPMKPNEKRRYIHIGEGGKSILRADLLHDEKTDTYTVNGKVDMGDMGWFEVGATCAKKLGLEYSKELPPL